MNKFSTNHPLIKNTAEYVKYKKQVSIHSEDRNIEKYPSASYFEIELPEDITNIEKAELISWCFPSNYDVFSVANKNLLITFKFTEFYPPLTSPPAPASAYITMVNDIYTLLNLPQYANHEYVVTIQPGSYSPTQFVQELENRFNYAVQEYIVAVLVENGYSFAQIDDYLNPPSPYVGGYNGFSVAFNEVSNKVWFGNNNAAFIITNASDILRGTLAGITCVFKALPDFSNWGLPSYIGFTRTDEHSKIAVSERDHRFFYTNYKLAVALGGTGDWINTDPVYPTAPINYIQCPNKINLMGPSHFYMEIAGLNNLDETSPYNVSLFTRQTNITNGRVNSAFAKIGVAGIPLSMFYEANQDQNYKYFDPPAERIRRLQITIRYHDGLPVNFETFNYSFVIQFITLDARIETNYKMR
jgi:hypothetical protein